MSEELALDLNEITIIGNVLMDESGEIGLTALQHVSPEDFTDARNREIFRACSELYSKGTTPDLATVTAYLTNNKTLEGIGGLEYLDLILEKTVRIAPVENYINSVKEKAVLNRFLGKMQAVLDDAKTKPIKDVNEFIGKASDDIIAIAQSRDVQDAKSMSRVGDDLVAKLVKQTKDFKEQGIKANGVTGTNTGYEKLDFLTKGWHKGDMIVIGARPSVGKTAFALNLLYQVARKGKPVLFFSLEMGAVQIAMRLLSLTSNLSTDEINSMEYRPGSTKDKLLVETHADPDLQARAKNLQRGLDELVNLPFYIDDSAITRMTDITTKCKKLQNSIKEIQHKPLGLIAIDYIGLITSPTTSKNDNRQTEVAAISRQIKQMARTLDVPVIALSQLSRDSVKEKRKPQMSDIRESGSIEQDADMIMMLHRPDYADNSTQKDNETNEAPENNPISPLEVYLMKNRNGETGVVNFIFDKPHCHFSSAENSYDNEVPYDENYIPDYGEGGN